MNAKKLFSKLALKYERNFSQRNETEAMQATRASPHSHFHWEGRHATRAKTYFPHAFLFYRRLQSNGEKAVEMKGGKKNRIKEVGENL